jgi:hypothetical protein
MTEKHEKLVEVHHLKKYFPLKGSMFKKNKQDILVRTNRGDLYYITYDDYDEEEDLEDKYN